MRKSNSFKAPIIVCMVIFIIAGSSLLIYDRAFPEKHILDWKWEIPSKVEAVVDSGTLRKQDTPFVEPAQKQADAGAGKKVKDASSGAQSTKGVVYPSVKKLTLDNCPYAITLVAGTSFIFPDSLKELGLELVKGANEYTLRLKNPGINTGTIGDVITVSGGSTVIVNGQVIKTGGGSNTITIGNNTVIVGGSTKELKITVPSGIDLDAYAAGRLDVRVSVSTLNVDIAGSSHVSVANAARVPEIHISGSGNVDIASAGSVGDISIAGSGDVRIAECSEVEDVSIAGSGSVLLPRGLSPGSVSIAGSGNVKSR